MDSSSLQNFVNRVLALSSQANGQAGQSSQWLHSSSLMWICLGVISFSWLGTVLVRLIFPKSFISFIASLTYSYFAVATSTAILTVMVCTSFNASLGPVVSLHHQDNAQQQDQAPNSDQPDTQTIGPEHLPTPSPRPTPTSNATPRPPD